jgi:hypothetical protein
MKIRYLTPFLTLAAVTALPAATFISQNFDTDPVSNYSTNASVFQASDPARYFAVSDTVGVAMNASVTGAVGNYIGGQNMDGDGDGTLVFSPGAVDRVGDPGNPGFVGLESVVTGWSNLQLSVALAGMPSVEDVNFVRCVMDLDGDDNYETMIFNFRGGLNGSSNVPYHDFGPNALPDLTAEFQTFVVSLPDPTSPFFRMRLELYNDTNTQTEASGIDTILITGTLVPEPTSAGLLALGGMLAMRRRRR